MAIIITGAIRSNHSTTVVPGGTALKMVTTVTDPTAVDGITQYLETHITGAHSGVTRGVGIWTNVDAGCTALAGSHFGLDVGIYDGSTDGITGQVAALNLDLQIASGSSPSRLAFIRTNSNQSGSDPDYLFWFNNDEAACLTKTDPGTSFYGYLKCLSGTGNVVLAIPVVNVT